MIYSNPDLMSRHKNTLPVTISMLLYLLYVVLFFDRNIFVNSCYSGSQNGSFRGELSL
jgi:hypothetical protein